MEDISNENESWEDVISYYLNCCDDDSLPRGRQHLINFLKANYNPPSKK